MRASWQLMISFIVCLLGGIATGAGLWQKDVQLQQLRADAATSEQAVHSLMHSRSLFSQWLITIDLFINDQPLYLAAVIKQQSAMLRQSISELGEHAPQAAPILNQHLQNIEAVIRQNSRPSAATDDNQRQLHQYQAKRLQLGNYLAELEHFLRFKTQEQQQQLQQAEREHPVQIGVYLTLYSALLATIWYWLHSRLAWPLWQLHLAARRPHHDDSPVHPAIRRGCEEVRQLNQSLAHLNDRLTEARERAVNQSRQAERYHHQLDSLLNAVPDAVLVIDDDGTVQNINRPARNLFGLVIDEDEQTLLGELIPAFEDSLPLRLDDLSGIECIGRRSDGQKFPLTLNVARQSSDHPGYTLVVHDLRQDHAGLHDSLNAARTDTAYSLSSEL
ncbi:PAS domain S-box protein [Marinobacterium arenosum]|uniref:PAS domain S-box protein n=1 Tax=Marinobacterium arenosum TaxID=2862496 RepID=UPI001C9709AA|nr:PAS domain S-box protein [Marinobacterium arenosum]MBY4678200.1 PAS domain S-box protein [Marinobacterium arenosum]